LSGVFRNSRIAGKQECIARIDSVYRPLFYRFFKKLMNRQIARMSHTICAAANTDIIHIVSSSVLLEICLNILISVVSNMHFVFDVWLFSCLVLAMYITIWLVFSLQSLNENLYCALIEFASRNSRFSKPESILLDTCIESPFRQIGLFRNSLFVKRESILSSALI